MGSPFWYRIILARIEADADVGAVQSLEKLVERWSVFLPGFKAKSDAVVRKKIGDPGNTGGEFIVRRVRGIVRKKTGVEGDEFQAKFFRDEHIRLGIEPVFFPSAVGDQSAGASNGLHGGIVFANGSKHSRGEDDPGGGASGRAITPDGGLLANGIEGDLQALDADGFRGGRGVPRTGRPERTNCKRRDGWRVNGSSISDWYATLLARMSRLEDCPQNRKTPRLFCAGGQPTPGLFRRPSSAQQIIDLGHEDPFRKEIGVAIAKK